MRSKRNLKRLLALALALLMVMACGALAMFAPASLAIADEVVGPVAFFVSLAAITVICIGTLASSTGDTGTSMAPKSRGDPKSAFGYDGASHDQTMENGRGRAMHARGRTWRPPKHIALGWLDRANIDHTPNMPPGEPHLANAGISTYAFNARDQGYSGLPALTSVLESCTDKARGVAAAFKKACSDLFTFDARARGTVMQV